MVTTNESYKKYVIDDLVNHKGLSHPVKTNVILRIKTVKINPKKLHPNPDDEFSMEDIGPNWGIVSDYERTIVLRQKRDQELFDEPLIAVRLNSGGYMLLNGHHRWMAAINVRLKKVPVKIVNITHEDDVKQTIRKSDRNKCITIDFDEVLYSDNMQNEDNQLKFPFNLIYKKNIRENASLLIEEFHRLGYDVWIYTGSYLSEQFIKGLFSINKCSVDGIVNGINGKKSSINLRALFREKYNPIVHVDNEMVTFVNTLSKKYEMVDFNVPSKQWASAVVNNVEQFDLSSIE